MMFTYWPRPSAFPVPPFSQLSLPDLVELDMANHQCQCQLAPFAPHSFPKGIDDGFIYCLRQNIDNTRSTGTQTDEEIPAAGVAQYSEEVGLDDPELANLCSQLAQRLLDIADGWASKLEPMKREPEGIFGRICSSFFRLW
uniref:Uncharacterized protein n=1 Tax=Globodera rostochiensis TaxID=31243 RepID=A0A914HWN6_GLORO